MRGPGSPTRRQSPRSLSKAHPLQVPPHPQPPTCHRIRIHTPTHLCPRHSVTRRVRPTCRMCMALIRYPTSRCLSCLRPLTVDLKRTKLNGFGTVSSAALRTARAKAGGLFARMLVRTAGKWSAKGGTVSVQTKLVGMRGREPHRLVGFKSGNGRRGGDVYCVYI
jgi:hypothetical protein